MLTSDLIKPFLRTYGRMLTVDQIDESSALWLQTARDLVELFQQQRGKPRRNCGRKSSLPLHSCVMPLKLHMDSENIASPNIINQRVSNRFASAM